MGFSDKRLAELTEISEEKIYDLRINLIYFQHTKELTHALLNFLQKQLIYIVLMNKI